MKNIIYKTNTKGNLVIGGCDATDLARQFGTPLYCLDFTVIKDVILDMTNAISKEYPDSLICYASKALSCLGMYQITNSFNLGTDVASGGELYTALKANCDVSKIYFHGNNKTKKELSEAIDANIHAIVVDSEYEIELLNSLCKVANKTQGVLVRVNPGVEAHTHEYIQTAKVDSKFGFSIENGTAQKIIKKIIESKNIKLLGLHCHIGSQIFETEAFELAVDKMTDFLVKLKSSLKIDIAELNMGGGFGIRYTNDDKPLKPSEYVKAICKKLKDCIKKKNIRPPKLILEPGRTIVGESGTTLYTVGAIKKIPDIKKTYIAVDGGMFENPRHALYTAKYAVATATDPNGKKTQIVSIAGKCCESGDILAKDVKIQDVKSGDLLAIFSTGAYNYSMASNYNRNAIPPVILCRQGRAEYLIKPQTYDGIVARDCEFKL